MSYKIIRTKRRTKLNPPRRKGHPNHTYQHFKHPPKRGVGGK